MQKVAGSPRQARPAQSLDYPRGDHMKQWLETREVLDFLAEARRAGRPAALATVVRVRGSAYRHEGAKLAVAGDGSSAGNVSGGCLEQDVREVALQVIRSGAPELRSYCSSADEIAAWDLGVGCEGQVDVYVERAEARARERALLDGRRSFVVCTLLDGKGETGKGKRVVVTPDGVDGDLGSGDVNRKATTRARELLEAGWYAVVMNHNFADDQAYVRALMKTPVAYVGMLGPRQRTERILRNLAAEGPMDEARVYGPVGLDIGTDGAEQVALAVIAEI